jgi:hypothetical protein
LKCYQTSGEIYYLRLFFLNLPAIDDKDACTHQPICGGDEPVTYGSYQQSAIAYGYVDSVVDARATFDDMCANGTAAQCRSYFVVLTSLRYATHAIFDMPQKMRYIFQDYITFRGHSIEVAYAVILADLEKLFHKSGSSLVKYGFPPALAVPTELKEACSMWMNVNVMT